MKVLVIDRLSSASSARRSPTIQVRLVEPLKLLAQRGALSWSVAVESAGAAIDLTDVDTVLFNRHTTESSLAVAREARRQGRCVLYDLDDWIFDYPDWSRVVVTQSMKSAVREHLALASAVTVSNERLKSLIMPLRRDAAVVPNGFNVEEYTAHEAPHPRGLNAVYTNTDVIKLGSFRDSFLSVLHNFLAQHRPMRLDVYGDPFEGMERVGGLRYCGYLENHRHKARLAQEGYAFAIAPLSGPEDPRDLTFMACKSPIKYFEYGGLGIPGIYSRMPVFEDVVIPGRTGLLVANTEAAWRDALDRMAGNADLRTMISKAARQDVIEKYHTRVAAERLYAALSAGIFAPSVA